VRHVSVLALTLFVACSDSGFVLRDVDAGDDVVVLSTFAECELVGDDWWASTDVAIDPLRVRSLTAVLCDREGIPAVPDLPCRYTAEVAFSDARASVRCGAGDPSTTGYRYALVRFVVD